MDRNVGLRGRDAFFDRAHAVAHFEAHVPQAADELLELSGERRVGVGTQQDQEIHIGVRIEFAAAVSTDCDERHPARHRAALPDLAEPHVDERAQTPHELRRRGVLQEFGAKRLPPARERLFPFRQPRSIRGRCESGRDGAHEGG